MPETRPPSRRPKPEKDKNKQKEVWRQARFNIGLLLTSLLLLWLFQVWVLSPLVNQNTEIAYSDFKKKLADHQIVDVTIGDTRIEGVMKNPKAEGASATIPFNTVFVREADPKLIEDLQNANVSYRFQRPSNAMLLFYVLPYVLLGAFCIWRTAEHGQSRGVAED